MKPDPKRVVLTLSLLGLASAADYPVQNVSRPLAGVKRAVVQLSVGAARLSVSALAGGQNLIQGALELPGSVQIDQGYKVGGGTATVSYGQKASGINLGIFSSSNAPTWTFRLSGAVPIDLSVQSGVGESRLDLSGLKLSHLSVESGVGDTVVTLPGSGAFAAELRGGVGDTVVNVPKGLPVRVQVDVGLGKLNISGPFEKRGDAYVSPSFDKATSRVDLRVEGGVGGVTVRLGQ